MAHKILGTTSVPIPDFPSEFGLGNCIVIKQKMSTNKDFLATQKSEMIHFLNNFLK